MSEQFLFEQATNLMEDLCNEILIIERMQFLEKQRTDFIDNKANGFNDRTLKLSDNKVLNLKCPRVRVNESELHYSLFEKHSRTTFEYQEKVDNFYTSRMYANDINFILDISRIPVKDIERLKNKYLKMYDDFINEYKKKDYDILKVDATVINSNDCKNQFTIYFVFGFYTEDNQVKKECLYFYISYEKENKNDWNKVLQYIIKFVDLSNLKLIISDMNNGLKSSFKDYKEFNGIDTQNCIWHRFFSLFDRIKGFIVSERKKLFSFLMFSQRVFLCI